MPQGNVAYQTESYRKGLVLGFTMAEIMLLVLFTILLLIAYTVSEKDKKIDKYKEEAIILTNKNNALKEIEKIIKSNLKNSDNFEEDFKELVLNKVESEELKRENKTLTEVKEKYEQLIDDLETTGLKEEEIIDLVHNNRGLKDLVNNQKGQLANLQKKIKSEGKGVGIPPCWATPDGKAEYIFDVVVMSEGLYIKDNVLSHRVNEQKLLPLDQVPFSKTISGSVFLKVMYPLYALSEKQNCRHYVRLYDATKNHEKLIYKIHRGVVESRFYIFKPTKDTKLPESVYGR